jgi:hypothetical protein
MSYQDKLIYLAHEAPLPTQFDSLGLSVEVALIIIRLPFFFLPTSLFMGWYNFLIKIFLLVIVARVNT